MASSNEDHQRSASVQASTTVSEGRALHQSPAHSLKWDVVNGTTVGRSLQFPIRPNQLTSSPYSPAPAVSDRYAAYPQPPGYSPLTQHTPPSFSQSCYLFDRQSSFGGQTSPLHAPSTSYLEDSLRSSQNMEDYRPAVPLPMLSGQGLEAIPDFPRLVEEANQRSEGLKAFRQGQRVSWDELRRLLERRQEVEVTEEEESGMRTKEQGEVAETSEKARELVELWRLSLMGNGRSEEVECQSEEGRERTAALEDADGSTQQQGGLMGTLEEDSEEPGFNWSELEDEGDDARFLPLTQITWEKGIDWGQGVRHVGDDSEEEQEEVREVGGASGGEEEEDAQRRIREWNRGRRGRSYEGLSPEEVEEQSEHVLRTCLRLNAELSRRSWTRSIIFENRLRHVLGRILPLGRLIVDYDDREIRHHLPPLSRPNLKALGLLAPARSSDEPNAITTERKHVGRRTLSIPLIEHAECALLHQATIVHPRRLCPREGELHFHRPRFDSCVKDWCWALRPVKEVKLGRAGRSGNTPGARRTIRTLRDLSAYEGDIALIEYVEERPPLLSNPGMASKLINLWRLSKEDLANQQIVINANESSKAATLPGLSRVSREDLGAKDRAIDVEVAHSGIPHFAEGQTIVLNPEDASPFLGQIEEQMRQLAIWTNMFKAPLFEHVARASDFLLIRATPSRVRDGLSVGDAQSGLQRPVKEMDCYAVREIPLIFLCGQMEPLMEVFHPDDIRLRHFRDRLYRFALTNKLSSPADHNPFAPEEDVKRVSLVDLVRLFDAMNELLPLEEWRTEKDREEMVTQSVLRHLRELAKEWEEGPHKGQWSLSADVQVDEIIRDISPEEVCVWESMVAGVRRLLQEGIDLVGKVLFFAPNRIEPILARNLQILLQDRKIRADRVQRSAEVLRDTARAGTAIEVAKHHKKLYEEVRSLIAVGAFILDEIQVAPWYLTHFYHAIHIDKAYGGMFKLSGLGDPSGVGEGFSYLPRQQREAGRTFKEVVPTLDARLQQIIGDLTLARLGVNQMNEILTHVWSHPASRREAQHRLSTAGYDEMELRELLVLNRVPKKTRVAIILDVDTGEVRAGAGVSEYFNTCNFIWNKQVNALSNPSLQLGDEQPGMELDLDLDEGDGRENERPVVQDRQVQRQDRLQEEPEQSLEAVQRQIAERAAALAAQRAEEEKRKAIHAQRIGQVAIGQIPRPIQVVKQLIKEVNVDGMERYRVRFLFAPEDVQRVLAQREDRMEQLRRHERRQRRRAGEGNKITLEVEEKTRKRKRAPVLMPLGRLKQIGKEHREQKHMQRKARSDAEKLVYERPLAPMRRDGRRDYREMLGQQGPGRGRGRRGGRGNRGVRITGGRGGLMVNRPHFQLNMKLDEVYSGVEASPYAKSFKRMKGKSIDLERIKKKMMEQRYASRQELLNDFATLRNEADAQVEDRVKVVYKNVIDGLRQLDEQEMTHLEAAIVRKNVKKQGKQAKLRGSNTLPPSAPPRAIRPVGQALVSQPPQQADTVQPPLQSHVQSPMGAAFPRGLPTFGVPAAAQPAAYTPYPPAMPGSYNSPAFPIGSVHTASPAYSAGAGSLSLMNGEEPASEEVEGDKGPDVMEGELVNMGAVGDDGESSGEEEVLEEITVG